MTLNKELVFVYYIYVTLKMWASDLLNIECYEKQVLHIVANLQYLYLH